MLGRQTQGSLSPTLLGIGTWQVMEKRLGGKGRDFPKHHRHRRNAEQRHRKRQGLTRWQRPPEKTAATHL